MKRSDRYFSISRKLHDDLSSLGIKVSDLVLYINSKCNLRCKHCYVGTPLLAQDIEIPFFSIKDFIQSCGYLDRITIIGGEPLLHREINSIVTFLGKFPILEKRITTNAINIEVLNLQTLRDSNIRICVSLDGFNREQHESIRGKGTFDKTLNNIIKLVKHGVDVEITHTINSINISSIFNLLVLCKSIGVTKVNLHRISLQGNALLNSFLAVNATMWRTLVHKLEQIAENTYEPTINLRFPLLFVNNIELNSIENEYHHHVEKSFYAQSDGNRIIIYPDKRVYISSEAFGTESFIGEIIDNSLVYNMNGYNELELFKALHEDKTYSTALINNSFIGDENYPISLSVSYKKHLLV